MNFVYNLLNCKQKKTRQKDAEQKNAPDWLTRAIFRGISKPLLRSIIPVDPGPAGDLGR